MLKKHTWTEEDDAKYRAEILRRAESRIPPQSVLDLSGVWRSEMRNWSQDNLGKLPPIDQAFHLALAKWYNAEVKKIIEMKIEDPEEKKQIQKHWVNKLKKWELDLK